MGLTDNTVPVTVPANSTVALGDSGTLSSVSILAGNGEFAQVVLLAAQHAVEIVIEIQQKDWGITPGGAQLYNIYWDATAQQYLLQNNTAAPVTFYISRMGIHQPDPTATAVQAMVLW